MQIVGSFSDLLRQRLQGWGSEICVLKSPPGTSNALTLMLETIGLDTAPRSYLPQYRFPPPASINTSRVKSYSAAVPETQDLI